MTLQNIIEDRKKVAHKICAEQLTHRTDGKKPQLHPESLWNVKLINILDTLTEQTAQAVIEKVVEWCERNKKNGRNGELVINYDSFINYIK